ncbi:flavin-containing monooxygenase [Ilumatobacter sp.]|uniref:flavin-containing monooxygenase n=1 Tax=Ilumatobacter sp. TaxID=1967498 RepID=UPI003B5269B5
MASSTTQPPPDVDVLIVGAGLSGIGMACHLTREVPDLSYAVVEARDDLGGTWDLFRYPGVRSDSDMFTLGYDFKPWASDLAIADGASIKAYIAETAAEHDVMRHISFGQRVTGASWDSMQARWTVTMEGADADGASTTSTTTCRWLQMCSGYYSYTDPHRPDFEGEDSFSGRIVHPQSWPDDLTTDDELRDLRIVVIGSGATSVTLVPSLAEGGAKVTMLQRTPTWIVPAPNRNPITTGLRRVLPEELAYRAIRKINSWRTEKLYSMSRSDPARVKDMINTEIRKSLGDHELMDPHFTPSYDPWDQRLCLAPDGDFFEAINSGRAEVVTDRIERFDATGIVLESGRRLDADVIVTATGLRLLALGGVSPVVDGERIDLSETFTYKGFMYSGIPNLGTTFGYINASWTLRADLVARYVCRLLTTMDAQGAGRAVPVVSDPDMARRPYVDDFPAGYMRRGLHSYPKQSDAAPWIASQSYSEDREHLLGPDVDVDDGVIEFSSSRHPVGA